MSPSGDGYGHLEDLRYFKNQQQWLVTISHEKVGKIYTIIVGAWCDRGGSELLGAVSDTNWWGARLAATPLCCRFFS
ncbi:hypothetical protein GCM10008018_49510 [Paenibacillus marchantiophytorum]|uniref:Uncharacterized protein n=1 Tax=Paenibacillus marchantiophytorum TaxID=1619310 RepID=A0ABQ1F2E7_9BACL|nr:hypothetical protein GCM10008018_49510 [Paenibacillus marchantiophytorum]